MTGEVGKARVEAAIVLHDAGWELWRIAMVLSISQRTVEHAIVAASYKRGQRRTHNEAQRDTPKRDDAEGDGRYPMRDDQPGQSGYLFGVRRRR